MMDAAKVRQLRQFIDLCDSNPRILLDPSVKFLADYVRSLGGRIPGEENSADHTTDGASDDDIIESDIELDGASIEPDNDPPPKMGDPSVDVSEESREAAQISKAEAIDAVSEGNLDKAIHHLTEAIISNPTSAILYAVRASIFLKMNKPNAAIHDANAALQINPDSAKGYKSRGMARAALGQWQEAAKDLHLASNLDYDEEIAETLRKVEPNVRKIEEHRKKYELLRKEYEMRRVQKEKERQRKISLPEGSGKVVGVHRASELREKLRVAAAPPGWLTVVYFTATWCGPCRLMGPVYENLAAKYPMVSFVKVDIDEVGDAAQEWGVSGVPAFFLVRGGKEVDRMVGADKNGLERKVALHATK